MGAPGSAGASLLLGEVYIMIVPVSPPRARKKAKTARFGPSAGKTESTAAKPPKFASFYPLEFFGLIHKRPGYDPFFAEKPFSPADEFVFMGLVVRSCHFDVTACAEARRLEKLHFACPNENSETTLISPTSPKNAGIAFCFTRLPLLEGFPANF